jgi:hypothetical protein
METTIGIILMALGPILAAILLLAVPILLGVMVWDMAKSRRSAPAPAKVDEIDQSWVDAISRRIQIERGVARAFVILGGVFWGLAAFAGYYSYQETGFNAAFLAASIPLMATVVTLLVGWYSERAAALMLTAASIAVVYYGVITQFEVGVWILMTVALIGPMMTAAVLFWAARRELRTLEIRLAQLEPAYATAQ